MNRDHIPLSYPGATWFVVQTNIGCQNRARLGLDAAGYRTFLPFYTAWVTHARLKSLKRKPLLDRYLFVEVDPARQSFETIRQTDGVELIITNNGVPVAVPSFWVNDLLKRQLLGEFDFASKDKLPVGAIVEIVEGVHESLRGVLTSISFRSGKGATVKILDSKQSVQVSHVSLRAVV
jgi:transcription antitermination factor NusG